MYQHMIDALDEPATEPSTWDVFLISATIGSLLTLAFSYSLN